MQISDHFLIPDLWHFLTVLAITQGRLYVFFSLLPVLSGAAFPFTIRSVLSLTLGFVLVPYLAPHIPFHVPASSFFVILLKEALIGMVIAFLSAIPFWIFEAMGFFVDNQRGAGIGGLIDPFSGNESAPFGQFMSQFFIIMFFYCGGFNLILNVLYQSYTIWFVLDPQVGLPLSGSALLGAELNRLMYQGLLYGSPMLMAMFLVELGLALISRFVPQVQVFILALPLKTAAGFFVSIPYILFLEPHIRHEILKMGHAINELSLVFR